jgi:hypothetical protein
MWACRIETLVFIKGRIEEAFFKVFTFYYLEFAALCTVKRKRSTLASVLPLLRSKNNRKLLRIS